jgi:hypothetical protein
MVIGVVSEEAASVVRKERMVRERVSVRIGG